MTDLALHIPDDWQDLYQAALAARQRAYAPYSRFAVGSALRGNSGTIYCGCNIENASSGLTICAERMAIWKAISAGESGFTQLIVVTEDGSTPCGACRQVMTEFTAELEIVVADTAGRAKRTWLSVLLPDAFRLRR